jgi:tetratricopeptide (TPR) repeat protein
VVSYSVEGTYVPAELRWLGTAILQGLNDPQLFKGQPPESWVVYQEASDLKSKKEFKEMKTFLAPHLTRHKDDPTLMFLMAVAMLNNREIDGAFKLATDSCRVDKGYCYGLHELGLQLLEMEEPQLADQFFSAAEKLSPELDYGRVDRGLELIKLGERAAAIAVFKKLVAERGNYPYGFYLGWMLAQDMRKKSAISHFDKAVLALDESIPIQVGSAELAEAIASAIALYRELGMQEKAQRLADDPLLYFILPGNESTGQSRD